MDFPNLTRTVAALAAYDAADGTDPDLEQLERLEVLGDAVGIAFGQDTADRNSLEQSRLLRPGPANPLGGEADLSYVRRMVRKFQEQIALTNELIDEVIAEEKS
jgi:hypothetical protein